jgi:hypothetical protein
MGTDTDDEDEDDSSDDPSHSDDSDYAPKQKDHVVDKGR